MIKLIYFRTFGHFTRKSEVRREYILSFSSDTAAGKRIDFDFINEVISRAGGIGIIKCMSCGICSASCIIRKFDEDFNPRKIIIKAILGGKEEILKDEKIWFCATCGLCSERCAKNAKPEDVIQAITNIAAEEGFIPKSIQEICKKVFETGMIYELDDFTNFKRAKVGLPEIKKADPEEIGELFKETKIFANFGEKRSK